MSEGPSQTRPRGPAPGGDALASGEAPDTKAAVARDEGAALPDDPAEKAYVAPQVLPKPMLPAEEAPEAKVVLNLPAEPVTTISEAEVRAARARRRTATVKIERAQVSDNLKVADLDARVRSDRPPPRTTPLPAPPRPRPLPDGDEVTPPARALRSAEAGAAEQRRLPAPPLPRVEAAAIATSRELDIDGDPSSGATSKGRSGLLVGVAALTVVAVGAYYVVQNVLPSNVSPTSQPTTVSTQAASPATVAIDTAPPPTAVEPPAPAPTISVASPAIATPPRSTQRPTTAPPRTAPPPRTPPPAAPKPVTKPTKSGDIPSEI